MRTSYARIFPPSSEISSPATVSTMGLITIVLYGRERPPSSIWRKWLSSTESLGRTPAQLPSRNRTKNRRWPRVLESGESPLPPRRRQRRRMAINDKALQRRRGKMKIKATLCCTVAVCLALTGCATQGPTQDQAKGAALGCGGAVALEVLVGGFSQMAAASCLAGAAAGLT